MRLLFLLLLTLLVWLQYRLWFGEGGAYATVSLQHKVEQQVKENDGLQQRNARLTAEVENLKSGESAAEERARSELGMIKPGETFYRVVEPAAPPAAIDASAVDVAGDDADDGVAGARHVAAKP